MRRGIVSLLFVLGVAGCSCGEEKTTGFEAKLAVSPAELDFGQVTVDASAERTFEARNEGSGNLAVDLASDEAGFEVDPTSATIRAGGSATFKVTFTPTSTTPSTGTIHIVSNGGDGSVALKGEGIAAAVRVDPRDGIDFGDAPRNRRDTNRDDPDRETKRPIALINAGSDGVEILTAEIVDGAEAFSGDFSSLLGVYAAAERREAQVVFDPGVLGAVDGALRITTNSPASPEILVPLTGRGVAPVFVACSRYLDEPEANTICTPELPEQAGGTAPGWEFGAFDDLEGRSGALVVRNEGNAPLALTTFAYQPRSPDLRFFTDEAMENEVDFASLKPVICPVDLEDDSCTHQGEIELWVEYRARGSICCNEGVAECIDLAPGGDCTKAANTDQGFLTILSNDKIWKTLSIIGRGRSRIAEAVIENYARELYLGDVLRLGIANTGEATLRVNSIMLSDPTDDSCAGGPPCDCSGSASTSCLVFRILPDITVPFDLAPDEVTDIGVEFIDPNRGAHAIRLWWDTTDPIAPRKASSINVTGLGVRPE